MLDHLQWESLESRRCKIQLTLFYKMIQDLVDIQAAEYFDTNLFDGKNKIST